MKIMELYKQTAKAKGLISNEQCGVLEQWAINNEVNELDISTDGNILVAKGVGHIDGIPFGVVGVSFVMEDKLKRQYKTEVERGYRKFLEEKAELLKASKWSYNTVS